jgi:hypothetical protein
MTGVWQKMYLGFILLAAMFVASGNGFAGEVEDQAVVGIVSAMQQALKLTDAQVKQVIPVVQDFTKHALLLKADGVGGEALQSKLRFLRDDMDSNLANYLTAEQMALWMRQREQSNGSSDKAALSNGSARSGDKSKLSTTESRPPNDDGVLVSGSSDKIKSSGVW